MALTGLKEDALKLILFGGKGGVGKTTCASSTGLYLAKEGFKTLVISTDPAHSLADSFGQKIGDEITAVTLLRPAGYGGQKGVKNLSALEVSAEKALSQFKLKYEGQIKKIFDTSTYLDQEDIDSVFALPIPGIDEVMGFKAIVDLIDEAKFDKYIVDTAPTGHALRLLTLPELLDEWIKVLAKMRWKYRYMIETFSGKYKPDEGDDFLMEMKKTVKRIESLLKDQNRCEFIAVTIPEDMAILETERMINNLNKYGIKVGQLAVNNVLESGHCEFCRERSKAQEEYIKQIRGKFNNLKTTLIPLQPREVKGIESLDGFKELLFEGGKG
ncbi:MAG: ArsA family ATPase [Actinobacteria bacterium]|nr:ArsA family ATPase [Actinomycetota bacterium]MCG2679390.1 ArsA family ATPase [Kiritimatiellia bacterium]